MTIKITKIKNHLTSNDIYRVNPYNPNIETFPMNPSVNQRWSIHCSNHSRKISKNPFFLVPVDANLNKIKLVI